MSGLAEQFVLVREAAPTLPEGSQLLTRPLDVGVGFQIFVAVDAHGQKHLLVEIRDEHGVWDRSSQGVTLGTRTLVVGGRNTVFADLHCRISALDLVFERLAEDVIKRLTAPHAGARGSVCRATLADWRSLLKGAASPLGRQEIVGIAGELVVLKELAQHDPVGALDAWQRWERPVHDFAVRGAELEVKSTAAVDGNFISVANLDQLDPTEVDSLHLVVVHFRLEMKGLSLDERIRELIRMGVPSDELIKKVGDVGYVFESEADGDVRLTVRSIRVWHVDDDYPGLRRSEIEHRLRGLSHIRYELALDAAPRPLGEQAVESLFGSWLE